MKTVKHILFFTFCLVASMPLFAQTDVLHLKSNAADTLFGQIVPDPYRWMEDLNSDSVKRWIRHQQNFYNAEKAKFKPENLHALVHIGNYISRYRATLYKTGPWYFSINSALSGGGQVLSYRKKPDETQIGDPLITAFDPNIYDYGKERYILEDWSLSDSADYLAVSLSVSGRDWRDIRVRDMKAVKNLPDKLSWVKFTKMVWWKEGFFYTHYKKPAAKMEKTEALAGQGLYYHKLGNSQDIDELIMSVPDDINEPIHIHKVIAGRFLVVTRQQVINGKLYNVIVYKDLQQGLFDDWQLIAASLKADNIEYDVVIAVDSGLLVRTNYMAPHYRLLRYELGAVNRISEIIPEKKEVMLGVIEAYNQLLTRYFNRGEYTFALFNYQGEPLNIVPFPIGISIDNLTAEPNDSIALFYENSFYTPPVAYKFNLKELSITRLENLMISYNAADYRTMMVFYHSKDGTEIPMYLTFKKGLKITGSNPVILYGHGGFGVPITRATASKSD